MILISFVTYYICLGVYKIWDANIAVTQLSLICKIIFITVVCAVVYGLFAMVVKIPYVFELVDRIKGRFKKI